MKNIEEKKELIKRIAVLKKLLSKLQQQLNSDSNLFNEENRALYNTSINTAIEIVEKQIEEYSKRLMAIQQQEQEEKIQERKLKKAMIAEQNNFSNKSDEELRTAYSRIRAQIKRIAKKIFDLCEHKDIPTFYQYSDIGEIVLVKAEGHTPSEMIYDMNEIISDLETNLSTIEDYYRGTDLKGVPYETLPPDDEYYEENEDDEYIDDIIASFPEEQQYHPNQGRRN